MKPVYFFLGANSEEGFFSLYDQLLGGRLDDLMILKGGPGCGKSTFMRRVGAAMERAGERIVYINCSGDPDSLDGAIFLDRNAAIVDGTSPHVLEPTYAVASERYVDLTRFYDVDAAKARRAEIVALSDEYRAHYRSAYRILRAMGDVANAEGEKWIHFDYVPGEPDIRDGGAMVTGRICVIGSKLNEEAVAKLFGVEKQ